MSVEPLDSMSDFWMKLQGQTVNDRFRLGRYLGGSDHSGAFLTLLGRPPAEVALKLISVSAGASDTKLAALRAAAAVTHPHLVGILESGRCALEGDSYLYVVTEYADQSLAQILTSRPLTEDEALEMLAPTLKALAFLHGRNLVQGQLKPANILAVGNQLKLASDTIRPISETGGNGSTASVYDPPEYRDGSYSTAGDIWGLGMSLLEALGRRPAAGLDDGRGVVAVPRDFPPTFRDIVAQCLARRPFDRPKVTELEAWLRKQTPGAAPAASQPAAAAIAPAPVPEPPPAPAPVAREFEFSASEPMTGAPARAARDAAPPAPSIRLARLPVILGAVVVIALVWAGVRMFESRRHAAAPVVPAAPQAPPEAASPGAAPSTGGQAPAQPRRAPAASAAVHSVLPDVPLHARQTIHGRIHVSVRVLVDGDGKVFAVLAEQPGPSRYFERLALDAAKKWTFPPDPQPRRVQRLRFEFTRAGTTASAVSVQ